MASFLIFVGLVGFIIANTVAMALVLAENTINDLSVWEAWGQVRRGSFPGYIVMWVGLPAVAIAAFCLWLGSIPSPIKSDRG